MRSSADPNKFLALDAAPAKACTGYAVLSAAIHHWSMIMNKVGNHMSCETNVKTASAEPTDWAPLPAAVTGIVDGQAVALPPDLGATDSRVHLGGQAPMFLPALIADAGFVRLGGQSPIF